jgi:hypothetical protein
MVPVETISEWGEESIKENGGRSEFKYDTFWYIIRTFGIATMYPHPEK